MKSKKIVLINSGYNISRKSSPTPIPPFGLLSLTSVLEKEGFEVEFLDFEFSLFSDLDYAIKEKMGSLAAPSFFGINLITGPGLKRSFKIIDFIEKRFRGSVPVVAGGPHATIFYEDLLNTSPIDIICLGEGEATVVDLARCLSHEKDLRNIPGIVFKKEKEIIRTAPRPMTKDLSALPNYAWGKIQVNRYIYDETLTVLYSRGCPYRCVFCLSQKFLGEKPRALSPNQVLHEIIRLKNTYSIKKFRMVDDLPFAGSIQSLREFCHLLVDQKVDLKLKIWGRINGFTLELAELLKRAGCEQIHFGVESGSEKVLRQIKKDIHISNVLKSAEICQKTGLQCLASFIVGFPFETRDDIKRTRQLISLLNKRKVLCSVHKLTPFPATPLWDDCLSKGLKPPKTYKDWEKYGSQSNFTEFFIDLSMSVKFEIWRIVWMQVFHEKWGGISRIFKNLYTLLVTAYCRNRQNRPLRVVPRS